MTSEESKIIKYKNFWCYFLLVAFVTSVLSTTWGLITVVYILISLLVGLAFFYESYVQNRFLIIKKMFIITASIVFILFALFVLNYYTLSIADAHIFGWELTLSPTKIIAILSASVIINLCVIIGIKKWM